ncbi:MAG: MFS transporter, partial [Chloroflexaceae bacterium]|nr:MFS transporter [Chloroflexaceae bacterium]
AQSARYQLLFQSIGLLFLLFALPCFVFVHEPRRPERAFSLGSFKAAWQQLTLTVQSSQRYPGLVRFLLGRLLYADAINTAVLFMGIYVTQELGYGFDAGEAQLVLPVAVGFAIVGGLLWSQVTDRLGPKRTLTLVLWLWVVILGGAALIGQFKLPGVWFWGVALLSGIALAGVWTADRPLLLRLTPPEQVGEFYGLYGMVGRFAAIMGPWLWAMVVDVWGFGRPAAMLVLMTAVVLSLIVLRPVSDAPRQWAVETP